MQPQLRVSVPECEFKAEVFDKLLVDREKAFDDGKDALN